MSEFWNLMLGWDYIVLGFMFLPFIIIASIIGAIVEKVRSK